MEEELDLATIPLATVREEVGRIRSRWARCLLTVLVAGPACPAELRGGPVPGVSPADDDRTRPGDSSGTPPWSGARSTPGPFTSTYSLTDDR